jgi:sulfite reductase (NADPH) flavoprotein alpha-component
MTASELPGPGLTQDQWEQIRTLAGALGPKQALWVSGYFAGLSDAAQAGQAVPPAGPVLAAAAARTLTILYGSETGNCTALAANLAAAARALGLAATVADMANYKTRRLKDEQDLLIVTSTYGEGDPPQPAVTFFEFVEGRKAPQLTDVRFAVLALGDSTYERYCEAGKRLDRRFEELGATRLLPRVDCDIDYDEPAAAWIAAVLAPLAQDQAMGTAKPRATAPVAATLGFDKRNPFPARIVENLVLTGRGSTKETRHVEFSLAESGLVFEPGDALGVEARNAPGVVDAILDAAGAAGDAPVSVKARQTTLRQALGTDLEITTLTPRFLEHWEKLSGAGELKTLLRDDSTQERAAFLRGHHVIDVLRAFPVPGLDAQTIIAGLRPLQPRLYSIASSLAAAPDEAHLTVATVRYALHGEPRAGVVSGYLADHGAPGETLAVYVQANPHFRLPGDDVPVVMIGAGTGVAPYRAFMQEREARGAAGRSWLFFGERNFRSDFLYQVEWQALLKDGLLTRMDVAFSRDGVQKDYVQHRMLERGGELFAWLEEGAHLYVCGDAAHLAPDVHETLIGIVQAHGGLDREGADAYVRDLQRDHRYQRDVY